MELSPSSHRPIRASVDLCSRVQQSATHLACLWCGPSGGGPSSSRGEWSRAAGAHACYCEQVSLWAAAAAQLSRPTATQQQPPPVAQARAPAQSRQNSPLEGEAGAAPGSSRQGQLCSAAPGCRTTSGISMQGVCDLQSQDVIQPCAWSLDSRQDRQKQGGADELREKYRIKF